LRRRGFDALAEATARLCAEREQARTARLASATRHAEALATAADAVARAQAWHARGGAQDLVAEELRAALAALADLIGRLAPEDLLDRLFARFCVGK
jgi:tRNA modification GTPase